MRVAGVDEAGRGPVIGPLAIAGVLLDEADLPRLADLGVRDSKLLSPRRRERLAGEIRELATQCQVLMLSPAEIDRVVRTGRRLHRLNRLEAQAMAGVITALRPDIAYVDASDVLPHRFGGHIQEGVPFRVRIVSEHKADARYPVVSAASILAKVERDRAVSALREQHGEVGSGYASDPRTLRFLEDCIRRLGCYPDCVRESWEPAKRLMREAEGRQTRL